MRIRRWGNTINARYEETDEMNGGEIDRVSDPLLSSDSYSEDCVQISEWQTSIISYVHV